MDAAECRTKGRIHSAVRPEVDDMVKKKAPAVHSYKILEIDKEVELSEEAEAIWAE